MRDVQPPHLAHFGVPTNADTIRGLLRFLRTIKLRRSYFIAALVVAGLLGVLYYRTVPRSYRATATLMVVQAGGEVWDPSMTRDNAPQDLMPTFQKLFHESVVIEGALERIRQLPAEMWVDFGDHPLPEWPEILRDHLATRGANQTKLIEISSTSLKPRVAEAVLRAVVDSYLEFMEQTHRDVSVELVTILTGEQKKVAGELAEKQQHFRRLSRQAQSFGLQNHKTTIHPVVARTVELNRTLTEVRKERLQLEASQAAIQSAIDEGADLRPHLVSLEPVLGPELVISAMGLDAQTRETVNTLSEKLVQDRARLATLLLSYGERFPEVVQLRQEIANAEQFLTRNSSRVAGHSTVSPSSPLGEILISLVDSRLAEKRGYEHELVQQYELATEDATWLDDQMVELSLLDHDIRLLRNLHDTLANRIADLGIKQNRSDVRLAVVSHPQAMDDPVSPQWAVVVACCLVGGLAVGTVCVYVVDLLDDRFRSREEISEQLGLPVLGMIPKLPDLPSPGIQAIQVVAAPNSVESEMFHTLRTGLLLTSESSQRLAITSSESGDGKTIVLANLAASMAKAGKRVLLIDADMRRPSLRRLFELPNTQGLSDVLRSNEEITACCEPRIQSTGIHALDILTAGPKPADPAELLIRPRFADLIGWAETVYDHVLVDGPPILAGGDAAILGRVVDNVLLLVQAQKNHRRVVLRAAESLHAVQVRMTGVVVNYVVEPDELDYYGYGHTETHPEIDEGLTFRTRKSTQATTRTSNASRAA